MREVMAEPLPIHPLTVHDYHAMAEAGILTEDDHIELIDGQLVKKMTIGPKHIRIVNILTELAVSRARGAVEVSIQNPARLNLYNEPEPDVVLLKADRDVTQVPKADDVLLLVEVADASVGYDRTIKLPRYAAAGIPEVWIVNIPEERLECYRRPSSTGYTVTQILGGSDLAGAELIPALGEISVDMLFKS